MIGPVGMGVLIQMISVPGNHVIYDRLFMAVRDLCVVPKLPQKSELGASVLLSKVTMFRLHITGRELCFQGSPIQASCKCGLGKTGTATHG